MLSWAVGFFVAALIAAVFGFGGIASSFMGMAQILFYVFLILFVVSLVASVLFRGAHTVEHGHAGPHFGGLGLLALVALIAVGAYAWIDHDMSAERLGRMIDRSAVNLQADASNVLSEAGDRFDQTAGEAVHNVRSDTANFFETASENVRDAD